MNSQTLFVSYIVDAVLFLLLIFIFFGKGKKVKILINKENYKDWITEGTVDKNSKQDVNIFSIEDLVNLAIDLDKRVIHDSKLNKFYIMAEDVNYVYDPAYVSQVMDGKQQIGRILLEQGVITSRQVETGLYYQKRIGNRLGDSLVALGFIDETTLYSTLAAQQKMSYYELDTKLELSDISWLSSMSLGKARALQALPLGRREDGKWVIACGESAWSGIAGALQEIFGPEIYLVASRPSHIYDLLEKLEQKLNADKNMNSFNEFIKERKLEAYERLSEEEADQFLKAYLKGKLDIYLFIKALGLANQYVLSQITDRETVISWLSSKNLISGEMTNMIIALNKLVKKQDAKMRQEKVMPSLTDLLKEARYISSEAADWVNKAVVEKKKPLNTMLATNYLASKETIDNANFVIDALKKLTVRAKIF